MSPEQITRAFCGKAPADTASLVRAADCYPNKFLPTLASSWRREGRQLSVMLNHVLDLHEARVNAYDQLVRGVQRLDDRARELRGGRFRSLYPEGIIRQQQDVDLAVSSESALWRIAAWLHEGKWCLEAAWIARDQSKTHYTLVFTRPAQDPYFLDADRVELSTRSLEGNYFNSPPRDLIVAAYPAVVITMITLLDELTARPLGMRDFFDFQLLLTATRRESHAAALGDAISRHGLLPEWLTLQSTLARLGLEDLIMGLPRPSVPLSAAARARRKVGWSRHVFTPARLALLAAAHMRRNGSARAGRMLTYLQERLGSERMYRLGVPLFTVPLNATACDTESGLIHFDGPYAELVCPAGTFALSAGGDIPESWLPESAKPMP